MNRTVDRAIQMLELIASRPKGISLNEITEIMAIPKSSGFDILQTLVASNMVERVSEDVKTYKIGVKAFVIGSHYINEVELIEVARTQLEAIADKYRKTVFIGQESDGKVVYVHKYQPLTEVVATCTVGSRNEFYNTALGRCILAFKPDYKEVIDKFVNKGKISDKEAFLSQIERIRKEKYAYSNQEHQIQIFCVAVPVFNHQDKLIGAISMSGLYTDEEGSQNQVDDLRRVAEAISKKMGYTGDYM